VLRPELSENADVVARFVQERTILTRLSSPHVVRIVDLVVEGDTLALVMELVRGPSLRQVLAAHPKLGPETAVPLLVDVLEGLHVAHGNGVVHRDVKPANVLLNLGGAVPLGMVTDFGIAGLTDRTTLTDLTSLLGTPAYMAPELAEGAPVTSAVDVYSAGIVLYEMTMGRTPFDGVSLFSLLKQHSQDTPERGNGIGDALWDVLLSMTEKRPGSRPSAIAAADALRALGYDAPLDRHALIDPAPAESSFSAASSDVVRLGSTSLASASWPRDGLGSADSEAPPHAASRRSSLRGPSRRRRLRIASMCVAVVAVLASVATYVLVASAPSWSLPKQIVGASLLDSISCATATFCATADFSGDVFDYNGSSWTEATQAIPTGGSGFTAHGVGCPSPTFCFAFFRSGGSTELFFYGGRSWVAQIRDGRLLGRSAFGFSTISCPSAQFCMAIGANRSGDALTATYEDGRWSDPRQLVLELPGASEPTTVVPYALSCAGPTFCSALNGASAPLTYTHGIWTQGRSVDPSGSFTSVSCPSASFCAAVDRLGRAYLFNGTVWSTPIQVDQGRRTDLLSISCADAFCAAIDGAGRVITYADGSWDAPSEIDRGSRLADISCSGAMSCVAVDQAGRFLKLG
jgi:serine/threonine protein kinase